MSSVAAQASREQLVAADAESRILAQTCFDRPLVLEAGAGTGKTTALVSRIAVWALGTGWTRAEERLRAAAPSDVIADDRIAASALQRVVAITFTDAAAAEMARGVGRMLSSIADGRIPAELHAPALPSSEPLRRQRAKALVGALDRLVVRTIHAFARRLLAAHPVEARLHPAFEVDADGQFTATLVRELLELRLRDAYGDPGDPELLGLAACGVAASELERELLALLQSATPPELLEDDPFDAARLERLQASLVAELEQLHALAAPRLATGSRIGTAADLLAGVGEACSRLRTAVPAGVEGMERLQRIVQECLEPRLDRIGKWGKQSPEFTKSEATAFGNEAAAIAALCASLAPRLRHLVALDAPRLDFARRALAKLLVEAQEALRRRGLVSYDGLLCGAARLLEENAAVTACERAQIDQLLVDEFQDTDRLQCSLVAALALEGPPEDRPGLFLVGDPKQSIYGWRGADLSAYDGFVDRVLEAGGLRRALSVNHRSLQPVLDEVQRVIRPVMREAPGLQPPFQPLVSHRPPGGAPVEYWISRTLAEDGAAGRTRKSDATALEARALAWDISQRLREEGTEARNIGVLLRSFGDVEEYLSALREAGIPYAVARDRSYYRRREIVDAVCLVRCVVDPGDALALVSFLRSSAVGVPDAALLPLWRQKLPSLVARLPDEPVRTLAEIRAAVRAAARAVPADVPAIEGQRGWEHGLQFGVEALCALRRSFAADPSQVFVERLRSFLLLEASEAARPLGAFRLANLERFFHRLGEALAEGADPLEALRQLRRSTREAREAEEARPLDVADQAVQVMSIHKAKGLGFAHTYVVQLHKQPGGGAGTELPPRAVRVDGRAELRLLGERTPGFLREEAREAQTAAAEDVRSLYVAMTRAKDRLVLAGLWPEARSSAGSERSHVALLRPREAGVPPLEALFEQLRADGDGDRVASNEALWVFPALGEARRTPAAPDDDALAVARGSDAAARGAGAEADARRVAAQRMRSRERMRRRFGGPASHSAHEALREELESRRDAEPSARSGRTPSVATAVGTAVHRALEVLDLTAEPARAWSQADAALDATLVAQLGGDELTEARARAEQVLERFRAGPLHARLRALAPHVIARELPVLLPAAAEGEGPIGYVAGAIDLVYRDPASGEPVIADYKTDVTGSGGELERHAERYASQAAHYVRAVREGFGLDRDPRFELWFLHAGRVVPER